VEPIPGHPTKPSRKGQKLKSSTTALNRRRLRIRGTWRPGQRHSSKRRMRRETRRKLKERVGEATQLGCSQYFDTHLKKREKKGIAASLAWGKNNGKSIAWATLRKATSKEVDPEKSKGPGHPTMRAKRGGSEEGEISVQSGPTPIRAYGKISSEVLQKNSLCQERVPLGGQGPIWLSPRVKDGSAPGYDLRGGHRGN